MTRQFLTIGQVIHIHDELVREFGGAFGIRDEGAFRTIAKSGTGRPERSEESHRHSRDSSLRAE